MKIKLLLLTILCLIISACAPTVNLKQHYDTNEGYSKSSEFTVNKYLSQNIRYRLTVDGNEYILTPSDKESVLIHSFKGSKLKSMGTEQNYELKVLYEWPLIGVAREFSKTYQYSVIEPALPIVSRNTECLAVGDKKKINISLEPFPTKDSVKIDIESPGNFLTISPKRLNNVTEPQFIEVEGENVGDTVVSFKFPEHPKIPKIDIKAIVKTSNSPPGNLQTIIGPIRNGDDSADQPSGREVTFKWEEKNEVLNHLVEVYDSNKDRVQAFLINKSETSYKTWLPPNYALYWRIKSNIDTCNESGVWTAFSQYEPFNS